MSLCLRNVHCPGVADCPGWMVVKYGLAGAPVAGFGEWWPIRRPLFLDVLETTLNGFLAFSFPPAVIASLPFLGTNYRCKDDPPIGRY